MGHPYGIGISARAVGSGHIALTYNGLKSVVTIWAIPTGLLFLQEP